MAKIYKVRNRDGYEFWTLVNPKSNPAFAKAEGEKVVASKDFTPSFAKRLSPFERKEVKKELAFMRSPSERIFTSRSAAGKYSAALRRKGVSPSKIVWTQLDSKRTRVEVE